jgi:hypothetical protein
MLSRTRLLAAAACTTALAAFAASSALAADQTVAPVDYPGVQHLHYRYGPITITPGQNTIVYKPSALKPKVPGYITRFRPDLKYTDGTTPRVDILHLHHGVWLMRNYPTFAAGEEKTITQFPKGFGYRYSPKDPWVLNYMLHNLVTTPAKVYLTWDVDFVADPAAAAAGIKEVKPLWLDTGNGNYPVWDAQRGWGKDGRYTFPDDARGAERKKSGEANQITVPTDATLVAAGGHLHPGGLYVDLKQTRSGQTKEIFRSEAKYFEPAGAVSWDVAMTFTKPDWRIAVKKGDRLNVSATYDTKRSSWYEVMGIMDPIWYSEDTSVTGKDPFTEDVDWHGVVTHGHLPENDNHGGTGRPVLPDVTRMLSAQAASTGVDIRNFVYGQGDMSLPGAKGRPPVIRQGGTLTFRNLDSTKGQDSNLAIYHTITACANPCNKAAGIAYPLANGKRTFDSGELGFGPRIATAAENRATWNTPKNLSPGTYSYFCRVHPFMRGSFRVVAR